MIQVIALGLISAGIYALFALGVVLVYRGTKVLTFAGGEIGPAALYVTAFLVTDQGLSWWVGAAVAVAVAAGAGALFEFALVRRSVDADPVVTSILTVALAATILAVELNHYGGSPKQLKPPVHGGVNVDGLIVSPVQIAAMVIAALLGFGLQAFLRRTDFGLAILAAADDPTATRLVGVRVSRVRMTLWAGSFALAAVAALLVEPTIGVITPGYASRLYLGGLAAAVIGGLDSLPGAVWGATVLGLAQAFVIRYLRVDVGGLDFDVTLVLLLVALVGRSFWPQLRRRLAAPVEAVA